MFYEILTFIASATFMVLAVGCCTAIRRKQDADDASVCSFCGKRFDPTGNGATCECGTFTA